ncbi:MAG: glutamine--fructose-6-phosphate transaminase (isomerizing) [Pirellulaceae bacterium]|jgi:glucosamine--fructose-6-phosphate aminotransferase (isomerizing)|nr:glutamine--fructose-6-phosphate transaminase (isomerizing) [Pirellulaceae bacterium]MDP7020549.1 glutamine--fructose-6-phosphate transaminase (isomerizing) [Pirellulaceae bacterium]
MCGIVGYIGEQEASPFLLEGLRRLEYRGYDSAGIVTVDRHRFHSRKSVGRIVELEHKLRADDAAGQLGIGHTRWATHGAANEKNAHPHFDQRGAIAVVHNGVVENFRGLRESLQAEGRAFKSETDSEVIAQLIGASLEKRLAAGETPAAADRYSVLVDAVNDALVRLRGTYGLVVIFRDFPGVMIAARLGSPIVLGVGASEHFVASDASPLVGYTDKIVYLADHQTAVITANSLHVTHRDQGQIQPHVEQLQANGADAGLDGYPHYMLKEIFEQPEALRNAMRGRVSEDDATAKFGGLNLRPNQLRGVDRIILTACGTSWHAGLLGEYIIEDLAGIPVEVEYASELRYRNPPLDNNTLLFAITQSGETADTLAALREMKRKGHPTLAICNVVGSSIAQEADGGVYLHAGPEVGVASTKAYTTQCLVLAMLALYFGRLRNLSFEAGQKIIRQLQELPDAVAKALETNDEVKRIAAKYAECRNFLYLGRQFNFPTALEGALKLKEISYLHAEGYPAAEMKHGPIALVDERTPSVVVVPRGFVFEKVMANVEEVKARGGPVIAVCAEECERVKEVVDDTITVPAVDSFVQPIVSIVPLQLLAYHIAVLRGCDVDKPRNLAKSVTVE